MLDPQTVLLTTLCVVLLLLIGATMFYPANIVRWLQRKKYQYEVTFSLYMLTPTEKFIFNSILFLIFSMVLIAASLYLPEHISNISRRATYYYAGDDHNIPLSGALSKAPPGIPPEGTSIPLQGDDEAAVAQTLNSAAAEVAAQTMAAVKEAVRQVSGGGAVRAKDEL
ncbi:hypothetical protein B0A49_01543 [Cryomyces minteri]|uniref:Uncharacterized protein n=1 Tax=Cryomyces minteri TaxID=331657 RepID=A0A4U0XNM6_9PEZI|nr:hypothetical protein B0A49_01543 [Cryomyces minteri]